MDTLAGPFLLCKEPEKGFLQWVPLRGNPVTLLPRRYPDAFIRECDQHHKEKAELADLGEVLQGKR